MPLSHRELVGIDEVYRELTAHPLQRQQPDYDRPRVALKKPPTDADNQLREVLAKRVTAH